MDKDNGTTFVGLNRMSEELRVHKRTINKWFRELSDRHLIERHQLKFNGRCCTMLCRMKYLPIVAFKQTYLSPFRQLCAIFQ